MKENRACKRRGELPETKGPAYSANAFTSDAADEGGKVFPGKRNTHPGRTFNHLPIHSLVYHPTKTSHPVYIYMTPTS